MNFLAHLFLADHDDAESLIGNLAGDFVKGPLHDRFTPGIRAGIALHRRVDVFTDSHPSVVAMRRVLTPDHGHYSRVINDVFIDHFLACSFDEFARMPLERFLRGVYATIDPHAMELPGMLRFVYPRMRDEDWLLSYREIDSIHEALTNMSYRLSRRPHLEAATHHLIDSRAELEGHFRAFFPDVVRLRA
jgi:acyl carrier protein phosphodiesterase